MECNCDCKTRLFRIFRLREGENICEIFIFTMRLECCRFDPNTVSIQKGILPPQAQQKIADLPGW
jgi:hypothetical protein